MTEKFDVLNSNLCMCLRRKSQVFAEKIGKLWFKFSKSLQNKKLSFYSVEKGKTNRTKTDYGHAEVLFVCNDEKSLEKFP